MILVWVFCIQFASGPEVINDWESPCIVDYTLSFENFDLKRYNHYPINQNKRDKQYKRANNGKYR